jgi:hypothetical protein
MNYEIRTLDSLLGFVLCPSLFIFMVRNFLFFYWVVSWQTF